MEDAYAWAGAAAYAMGAECTRGAACTTGATLANTGAATLTPNMLPGQRDKPVKQHGMLGQQHKLLVLNDVYSGLNRAFILMLEAYPFTSFTCDVRRP
ncbi:hypothetical protein KGM_204996 [Danaus plexippus plexippus]|uniref:Uncharacterized protein n=1 Tax=Danaus plexippus plexippus TaxID=278856 RepID=A0A212FAI5_DANPL|nr:hypothetical protein KGM_204996 [Danaus plexippus plexippus]